MSSATITLVGTPDRPGSGGADNDMVALARQAYGDLLRAAQATLAADAAGMPNPLGWLRDALTREQLPAPGARPSDFVPVDPQAATWGRW
jgi:hypothetical protein